MYSPVLCKILGLQKGNQMTMGLTEAVEMWGSGTGPFVSADLRSVPFKPHFLAPVPGTFPSSPRITCSMPMLLIPSHNVDPDVRLRANRAISN